MKMTSRKSVLLAAAAAMLFAVPASSYEFNGFRIEGQAGWDQFKVDNGYWGLQNAGLDDSFDG